MSKEQSGITLVQHIVGNNEVEMASLENSWKGLTRKKFDDRRKPVGPPCIGFESDRRQRALTPGYLGELSGKRPIPTAYFENTLPR